LLAFIALAFAPVPWIFDRYGERWRNMRRSAIRMDMGQTGRSVGVSEKDKSFIKVSEVEAENV
jgi:hypothetical protein